jgi:hypothetical protein
MMLAAALVLLIGCIAPPTTWADPPTQVYDVPDPEQNSGPGDDDEPAITGATETSQAADLQDPRRQASREVEPQPKLSQLRLWIEYTRFVLGRWAIRHGG